MKSSRDFESVVLPLLDSAFNLARWLLREDAAAQDAVQEACLRAFRYFHAFQGGAAKPWFLGIVRNTCYSHLEGQRQRREQTGFDEDALDHLIQMHGHDAPDPAKTLEQDQALRQVDQALNELPAPMREVLVLREIEGLDYAAIALVTGAPIGTVMSRLSRARTWMRARLAPLSGEG
jgi:RNA polymerase sigma-70 factor (ECF subfamily)